MKIDYAWTANVLIERIASDARSYRTWLDFYWRDRVRDTLEKNSEAIKEKAEELQVNFRDVHKLTDKFVDCNIDELINSSEKNYYNCTQLESEIMSFKAASDAICKV